MLYTAGSLRVVRRMLTSIIMMLTVSLAAAAIVMYVPASPVVIVSAGNVQLQAMNEYVQLHRARNAAVPNDMAIDIATGSK